jgi:hypothetical protein
LIEIWVGWCVIEGMATKHNLLADCVIRKDGSGQLWLMDRRETGWASYARSITSEAWLLEHYNVKLGSWAKDEHGEYCPVHVLEPLVVGAGIDLRNQYRLTSGGEVLKVALTQEQSDALNSDPRMVPIVVNGELARDVSLNEVRARFLARKP